MESKPETGNSIFTSDDTSPVAPEQLDDQLSAMELEAKLLQDHMNKCRENAAKETSIDIDPYVLKQNFTQVLSKLDTLVEQTEHLNTLLSIYDRDRKDNVLKDSLSTSSENLAMIKPLRSTLRGLQHEVSCLV